MNDLVPRLRFAVVTQGLGLLLRIQAQRHLSFREQLKQQDFTAQLKLADNSFGRYFRDAKVAARILSPKRDRLEFLNVARNSQLQLEGPGRLVTQLEAGSSCAQKPERFFRRDH